MTNNNNDNFLCISTSENDVMLCNDSSMIRVWLHNHRDTHTALAVGTITHRYNIVDTVIIIPISNLEYWCMCGT